MPLSKLTTFAESSCASSTCRAPRTTAHRSGLVGLQLTHETPKGLGAGALGAGALGAGALGAGALGAGALGAGALGEPWLVAGVSEQLGKSWGG